MVIYNVSIKPPTGQVGGSPTTFELTGSVDSVAVTTPERVPTPTAGSNSKPHFQATLAADGQLFALSSYSTTPCAQASVPLSAAATMLFVTLPPAIAPNESWSDTVSTVTCRGRMPVVATATRHYSVLGDTVWEGRAALLIARVDSLKIESRPDSTRDTTSDTTRHTMRDTTAETMKAAGTGRADFMLYVDPSSGVLLQATGKSHTEILVTTGHSAFPFREDARQTITLLR
jgi:hypothetical protein